MQRDRTDAVFLWDMLDAAQAVVEFTTGKSFDDYQRERLLRAGVERSIEIIGEAARRVSRAFQSQHPEIPWTKRQRGVFRTSYDPRRRTFRAGFHSRLRSAME